VLENKGAFFPPLAGEVRRGMEDRKSKSSKAKKSKSF